MSREHSVDGRLLLETQEQILAQHDSRRSHDSPLTHDGSSS